jgi:HD-GYP domain-containing protein (c-di-GMP phosphodiesterase class II)
MKKTSWLTFLSPPQFSNYEETLTAKLLHYMLIAGFLGALIIGGTNFINGWTTEATFLMVFALICLVGLYLNSTRFSRYVGLALCISFFLVINLMLYNGLGLYDETVLAFPVFMIFTSFLFGRRGLWVAAFLSVLVVIAFYILQKYGLFESNYVASSTRVFILSSLLVITALIIWVVHSSWKMNLLRLRESYDLTLQGWAKALEYRDGETAGHTRRVTELTVALAQNLGLSDEEIRNIQRGAYLHDIGKMAIPDHILLKPGPLTEEEWELMRQHPVRAREFISEIPYLQPAAQLAYSHHERWDGSGYPEGLCGEQIPLSARIFTVIDNWDALNSDRPYRKAWAREKVITYLKENAGSIFDPAVVAAFLNILERPDPDCPL